MVKGFAKRIIMFFRHSTRRLTGIVILVLILAIA